MKKKITFRMMFSIATIYFMQQIYNGKEIG